MSPEQIFSIANLVAVLCWILLALLPARPWVTDVVTGKAAPALFAAAYIAIVIAVLPGAEGSFSPPPLASDTRELQRDLAGALAKAGTLTGVAQLFTNQWVLLAGWLHYLAFDLLIGTWEARDSVEHGAPRWVLILCLFLTLMFGPMGWLAYVVARLPYRTSLLRA